MATAPAEFWTPLNFQPYPMNRVPLSTSVSRDHKTYPSGSPNNPGYAYGTFLPLEDVGLWFHRFLAPYTIPVSANGVNTIPMSWNNSEQWINPGRALRLKGLTTQVPGIDTRGLDAIQTYLGNAQG